MLNSFRKDKGTAYAVFYHLHKPDTNFPPGKIKDTKYKTCFSKMTTLVF